MKNYLRIVTGTVLGMSISACTVNGQVNNDAPGATVQSSGKQITDVRQLAGSYHDLNISVPADVTFTISPTATLTVQGDDNIVKTIETRVQDGVLIIKSDQFSHSKAKVALIIANPELQSVNLSGATNMTISGLKGGNLDLSASGANKVVATGSVDAVKIHMSGAGDVNSKGLKAITASVSISGTGDVSVNCTKSLAVSISGMGNVTYSGKPAQVQKNISGMGKVTPI
jgi:Putative auto-transporter adhesin, head GIN domain